MKKKSEFINNTNVFYFCMAITLAIICLTVGCTNNSAAPIQDSVIPTETGNGNLITVTDSADNIVTFNSHPDHIVSLSGDVVELLIALDAGDCIVGTTKTSLEREDISPHIPNAVSISGTDSWTPNLELLSTLQPDLIILYTQSLYVPKNINQIAALNISMLHIDGFFIPELPHEARVLGEVLGREEESEEYAQYIENYLELIESRLENKTPEERPKVYIEMYGDYQAQGNNTQGDAIMTLLKAENIAHDLELFPTVSPEWVISQDPEVVIKFVSSTSQDSIAQVYNKIISRNGLSDISAIKNNRVYVLSGDIISSPRGIVGLLYLAKALYPDDFSDIDPDQILQEYCDNFHSGADKIATYCPALNN